MAPQVGENPWLAANHILTVRQRLFQHAERMHVGLENRLLLAPFIGILFAQPHDRAQRLDVEATGLCLGVNVADIIADCFLLFLQPLDALDESLQMVFRKAAGRRFRSGGRPTSRQEGFHPRSTQGEI